MRKYTAVLIGSLLLQACTQMPVRDWPVLEGRVLDAQTEAPIEDAFVVARWIGFGGYSQSQCFHVEVARTDARGQYRIESWRNDGESATLTDQRRHIDVVHKAGYRLSDRVYKEQPQLRGVWYLEGDHRAVGERLEYLRDVIVGCGTEKTENIKLLLFYTALRDEVRNLPKNAEQKKIAIWLQNHIDVIEIGFEAAEKLYIEKLKSIERSLP